MAKEVQHIRNARYGGAFWDPDDLSEIARKNWSKWMSEEECVNNWRSKYTF